MQQHRYQVGMKVLSGGETWEVVQLRGHESGEPLYILWKAGKDVSVTEDQILKPQEHYNLCWDCYERNDDYFLEQWYNNIAGHGIGCGGTCDVCKKEIK